MLLNPDSNKHPLVTNKTLHLLAWVVSGKSFGRKTMLAGYLAYLNTP